MMGETVGNWLCVCDGCTVARVLNASPIRLSGDAQGPEGPADPTPTLSGNATAPGVTVPSPSHISESSESTRLSPSAVSPYAPGPTTVPMDLESEAFHAWCQHRVIWGGWLS